MKPLLTGLAAASLALLLTACAGLGIKSQPWPQAVEIHDREAVEFYRSSPPVDGVLASGLGTRPLDQDPHLVGLAVSGGGARAAAFTLGILSELQRLEGRSDEDALDRIDFISANSGGSWGVAAYLTDRARAGGDYHLLDRQSEIVAKFVRASTGRIGCWASRFDEHVTRGMSFADLYDRGSGRLPPVFFNAALLPAQYPFVFSEPFVEHYRVSEFGACGGDVVHGRQLQDLPVGFAAATSGSVPGYYASFARTGLCDSASPAKRASFCHSQLKGGRRDALHLVDGGLYDNIGFKAAYEIFFAHRDAPALSRRSLLVINSTYDTSAQTVAGTGGARRFIGGILTGMGFPGQDATFDRLMEPMFRSVGVGNIVLLDFYSTAGFSEEHVPLLQGLPELAHYAATNVLCYEETGEEIPVRRQRITPANLMTVEESVEKLRGKGGDCLSTNFYRTGTLAKTTYKADEFYFRLLWQLGQLSVRMNAQRIREAAF